MTLINVLVLLCGVLLSLPVQSQQRERVAVEFSDKLTLSSLVTKVYDRQPAHNNSMAQQQLVDANQLVSQSVFAGQATVNISHQNDVVLSDDGLQEWESSISVPLWLAGQQDDQMMFTQSLSSSLLAFKRQLMLASAGQVRDALWAVIKAETQSEQYYQVWQTARKIEQDVAARVKIGELASTELLLVNTHVIEMQNDFLVAQATLEQTRDSYFALTGEHQLPSVYDETVPEQTAITAEHPQLAMLDSTIASLQAQQHLAQYDGAINPNLSLGVRRERQNRAESFNTSVGVAINFALGNTLYQQPAIAQAAKNLADAQVARQLAERALTAIVLRYQNELDAKTLQIALLEQQLTVNKRYLQLQQKAFDLGEINLVDLLRTQSLVDQAENKKHLLEVDVKHTIANLNQAIGYIP